MRFTNIRPSAITLAALLLLSFGVLIGGDMGVFKNMALSTVGFLFATVMRAAEDIYEERH